MCNHFHYYMHMTPPPLTASTPKCHECHRVNSSRCTKQEQDNIPARRIFLLGCNHLMTRAHQVVGTRALPCIVLLIAVRLPNYLRYTACVVIAFVSPEAVIATYERAVWRKFSNLLTAYFICCIFVLIHDKIHVSSYWLTVK